MARFHKWTRTVPASIRLAGWFLCLSLAFSCTAAQPPRPSPPKPPPEGHWTEVLPNDLVEVRLEAHSDCALILGKRLGTKLQRGMVCLDAESGTVVWERSDPGLPGDLLVAPGRFIHSDRERLVAHDRTTGEVVWR
ncbi:MAG: PQQ-binding-like beta-propeller repeat protein, partial [Myxococcota bacterium]